MKELKLELFVIQFLQVAIATRLDKITYEAFNLHQI